MFARDDEFFSKLLNYENKLTDKEYVKMIIEQNRCFFNQDRGHTEAKKANLGDIKSTKIESPHILSYPLYDTKLTDKQKGDTQIRGNIKAIIPLMREKFTLEYEKIGEVQKDRYKRDGVEPLREKRIFGIMTAYQVGHIPNL